MNGNRGLGRTQSDKYHSSVMSFFRNFKDYCCGLFSELITEPVLTSLSFHMICGLKPLKMFWIVSFCLCLWRLVGEFEMCFYEFSCFCSCTM